MQMSGVARAPASGSGGIPSTAQCAGHCRPVHDGDGDCECDKKDGVGRAVCGTTVLHVAPYL
jgi:hypothetical protein